MDLLFIMKHLSEERGLHFVLKNDQKDKQTIYIKIFGKPDNINSC